MIIYPKCSDVKLKMIIVWFTNLPDIKWVLSLTIILGFKDEGSHWHVSNVLSDPVHLDHHPVHPIYVLTYLKMTMDLQIQIIDLIYKASCASFTCYEDNCTSTGSIHTMGFGVKPKILISWFFIFQCHCNLFKNTFHFLKLNVKFWLNLWPG